jgi:predicted amidohydrolase/SAM-dependent methyltransferase
VRALLVAMVAEKGSLGGNLDQHLDVLERAAAFGCEIAVFPEMSLTGSVDPRRHPQRLVEPGCEAVERVVAATGRLGVAALFGIAERAAEGPYITQLYASGGVLWGRHRKRYLGEGEEGYVAGDCDRPPVFELEGNRFGVVVCAEAHRDEPWASVAAGGARLAFMCAAPGLYGRRTDEGSWRAGHEWWVALGLGDACRQARRHRLFVGIATQAGRTEDEDFPGLAALVGPNGQVLRRTPHWGPDLLLVEVPVEEGAWGPAGVPAAGVPAAGGAETTRDRWYEWITSRRQGGSDERVGTVLERLAPVRDAVLEGAGVGPGKTLLDVGAGDGLVGLAAAELVGDDGHVILSDISVDLLGRAEALAVERGVRERCRFVQAPADDLSPIPDRSVDAVTTRSVLIYVKDKAAALREFHRVLRAGGRVSIYEPVNRLMCRRGRIGSYDMSPVAELQRKVDALYDSVQDPCHDPMLDFDEQDLLGWAEEAGFGEVHLELHVDVEPEEPAAWDAFVDSAPNPLVPTLREAIEEVLTPAEAAVFERHLRPLVEHGVGQRRTAGAYVWGRRLD